VVSMFRPSLKRSPNHNLAFRLPTRRPCQMAKKTSSAKTLLENQNQPSSVVSETIQPATELLRGNIVVAEYNRPVVQEHLAWPVGCAACLEESQCLLAYYQSKDTNQWNGTSAISSKVQQIPQSSPPSPLTPCLRPGR